MHLRYAFSYMVLACPNMSHRKQNAVLSFGSHKTECPHFLAVHFEGLKLPEARSGSPELVCSWVCSSPPLFPILDELALPDCVYQAPVSVV